MDDAPTYGCLVKDDRAPSKLTWRPNVKRDDDHVAQVLGEKVVGPHWRRQLTWLAWRGKDSAKEFLNRDPTISSVGWCGPIEHDGDAVIEGGAKGIPITMIERGKVGVKERTWVAWRDASGAALSWKVRPGWPGEQRNHGE